jgi:cell wall-associated NlpC family hydrolase
MLKVFSIILIATLFVGCTHKEEVSVLDNYQGTYDQIESASLEKLKSQKKQTNYTTAKTTKKNYMTYQSFDEKEPNSEITINDKLYNFYEEWKGVKYKLGGTSKAGVDCSGFIQKLFAEKLDLDMPRTANDQSQLGKDINKQELNTGDLVFFKTGRNTRHVGIYLNDGKFLHASTKNGVMISSMDSEYYTKHYWKSKRIMD